MVPDIGLSVMMDSADVIVVFHVGDVFCASAIIGVGQIIQFLPEPVKEEWSEVGLFIEAKWLA